MKGSYWFKAKSKKVLFEFSIRRNITVIKGDSATGKTKLRLPIPKKWDSHLENSIHRYGVGSLSSYIVMKNITNNFIR